MPTGIGDYVSPQLPVDHLDSTMPKDKYDPPNERRQHRIMQRHEVAEGKQSRWSELEISGCVQNLSLNLWKVKWLTVLYLDNNHLSHIPSQIGLLVNLEHLDASHNYIHQLPPEIGELVNLRELKLNSNRIQELPCELGKCFQVQTLDLSNNPLNFDVNKYYSESVAKLMSVLLDSMTLIFSGTSESEINSSVLNCCHFVENFTDCTTYEGVTIRDKIRNEEIRRLDVKPVM